MNNKSEKQTNDNNKVEILAQCAKPFEKNVARHC